MTLTNKTREKNRALFPTHSHYKSNAATIALLSAILLATIYNLSFWHQLLSLPDISVSGDTGFLLGTGIVLTGVFFTIFSLYSYPYTFKTVVSFTQTYSSGTSTAESLPCMFSHLTRGKYSVKKAAGFENILDVLQRLGVKSKIYDRNLDIFKTNYTSGCLTPN
ncbi:hypothetical protein KAI46_16055 [bacterium]|nr:hypothetical protein [bacterium]